MVISRALAALIRDYVIELVVRLETALGLVRWVLVLPLIPRLLDSSGFLVNQHLLQIHFNF